MNLQSIKPQNLIAAVALIAPIALVQTVRLVFGGGPEQASAMSTGNTPTPPTGPGAPAGAPTPVVTPKQKAAIDHLKALRSEITIYSSPFNHLVPQATTVQSVPTVQPSQDNPDAPPVRPAELPPEVRSLSLGALMVNENGPLAVVSGRVRVVGEVVAPGWTVTAIDTEARRVTITSDDGVSVVLTQNR